MNLYAATTPTQAIVYKPLLPVVAFSLSIVMLFLSNCVGSPHGLWPAPEMGVVVDENMKVVDIDVGSPAEKVDIQKGDVLISIGGAPFTEKEKADAVIHESPGEAAYEALAKGEEWQGKVWPLVLERNGEKIELQIMPAPGAWWGLSPTPTPMNPEEPLDYL